jgi:crossover junction endodeoxyribonuclease RuvC
VRVFGIDPGSSRTGYGCVDSDGTHHRLVASGALTTAASAGLPEKLQTIHAGLLAALETARPDCAVVETLFHGRNARSALVLAHARGVAVLAAVQAGLPVVEYTPTEIKLAVVGYGRAEKSQMQEMVKLLLGLDTVPTPHDAADALAVAICHAQTAGGGIEPPARRPPRHLRSWRHARVSDSRRQAT